ncbi:Coiled-coil domain-containing protein 78 [Galemys pyrenaicus]|uniref:Coiled-coil domain-containing protein 78 n=1 Tax=Galemys pyrenaicus TaxID=202257 RepID=A0A8J5ZSU2_GALPY|nr:Coiled-coil domain-containing protein 78 [Galemys pyrenaicus]
MPAELQGRGILAAGRASCADSPAGLGLDSGATAWRTMSAEASAGSCHLGAVPSACAHYGGSSGTRVGGELVSRPEAHREEGLASTQDPPQAKDWLTRAPGSGPAWAGGPDPECPPGLALSEEQRLQIAKELVDLQITAHRLQGQQELDSFALRSEVLRLEGRVLEMELELQGQSAAGADPRPHPAPAQGPSEHRGLQVSVGHPVGGRQPGRRRPALRSAQVQPAGATAPKQEQQEPGDCTSGAPGEGQGAGSRPADHRAPRPQGAADWALEARVAALGRQLQGAREEARTAGHLLATQAVALSTCQDQLHQAEAENARLQLQLKKLSQECALRLQRCAQEAAGQAGRAGQGPQAPALGALLEAALDGIRAAHHFREQQLARAARTCHKRLADLSRAHEAVLATQRWAEWQVEGVVMGLLRGLALLTVGALTGPPRTWSCGPQAGPLHSGASRKTRALQPASWAQVHQQLQEFSLGTQAALEQDRARLLVRAHRAEAQLSELQDYVDQHLSRWLLGGPGSSAGRSPAGG